ncbi:MAG: NADH-quinone oxidoreductase subunit NuoH [Candidatus Thermoplasmatota archaeon]|jgi:NADH-quinone oxidoreductase subunit H|nr:NADH-quinone oxidoreductase subunit NuoH [Candidatus Thermoplasmatota archaeon]MCL5786175.1 NADH-quinone oxidoreductase subunit NuoH [Candidatus Thermoplasmatota archaeon]
MSLYSRLVGLFSPLGNLPSEALSYIAESLIMIIIATLGLAFMIYLFRKFMARLQLRIGPNRVGKFGLLQVVADGLKLAGKESIFPKGRDDLPYRVAPLIGMVGLILAFAVLPYGSLFWVGTVTIFDASGTSVSVILLFAIIAIMPIGEVLAGISSRNKYALLGSLRSIAKDVSFEVPMMISVLAVVMMASARTAYPLSINSIVTTEILPYGILEPLGIFVFMVSMVARASYTPFDMGESDSELITGYSTEYSGMRFAMFYMGLFGSILLGSFMVSLFYLGGFNGPLDSSLGVVWLVIKALILVLISFTIWLSMPRIRIDKFVNLGWKYLLPLSMINLILSGILTLGMGW